MNKKILKALLKIGVSFLLLYLVSKKIEFSQIFELYKKSQPLYIILAVFLFITSQLISSFRLNYILHHYKFNLHHISNLKLYFVGMFYNFFIPSGIGGDAYKVFILHKEFDWNIKQLTKCILVDRIIGLLAIICLFILIAIFLFSDNTLVICLGFIVSFLSFYMGKQILKHIFKDTENVYNLSFCYSIIIQLFQITTIIYIVKAFNLPLINIFKYCLVFLTSSILSVVSFAGFGSREYVFLKASRFLVALPTVSTSIALSFNILTALVSLLGVIFMILKLNLKTVSTEKI